jgi:hypothetical protein
VGPKSSLDVCEKSQPHRDSVPDRPARSQSLYRLSYSAHTHYCAGDEIEKNEMDGACNSVGGGEGRVHGVGGVT